jgi:hypothetical protein
MDQADAKALSLLERLGLWVLIVLVFVGPLLVAKVVVETLLPSPPVRRFFQIYLWVGFAIILWIPLEAYLKRLELGWRKTQTSSPNPPGTCAPPQQDDTSTKTISEPVQDRVPPGCPDESDSDHQTEQPEANDLAHPGEDALRQSLVRDREEGDPAHK